MKRETAAMVQLVASPMELPRGQRVWGTGGWQSPQQREALDWLTLARFLGWDVAITYPFVSTCNPGPEQGSRVLILGCDPDCLAEEFVDCLADELASESLLVVGRAGAAGSALARLAGVSRGPGSLSGCFLAWSGPGPARHWQCRNPIEAGVLTCGERTTVWASLEGHPLVVARAVGLGVMVTLAFHPSQARDADGSATALLREVLTRGAPAPVAWMDWQGCLILRMDDPGSAQSIYHRAWSYPKLREATWAELAAELRRRHALLSIGYVSGWVDDGEKERGILQLAGSPAPRIPGEVYPSPLVTYEDRSGHLPDTFYDYAGEYRGIRALQAAGLGDIELHGYTHIHPDRARWLEASDRYDAVRWYRELGDRAEEVIAAIPPDQHPLSLGKATLQRYFEVHPTTLIPPGDEWANSVLERALDLGLSLVSSYYLAIRDAHRFCWATHVCAPYLDEPAAAWFAAGLPVVGCFHDYELALEGVDWLRGWLDRWQAAGARRFLDFRELASALACHVRFQQDAKSLCLVVNSDPAVPVVRPLEISFRLTKGPAPAWLSVLHDGRPLSLQRAPLDDDVSRVVLPCSP